MNKINFVNNQEPAISAENLNQMQNNMEEVGVAISPTEPATNEKVWLQKGKNIYNPNTMPVMTGLWGNSSTKKLFSSSSSKYVVVPIKGGNTVTISKQKNAMYICTTANYPTDGVSFVDDWFGSETINKATIITSKDAKYLFIGLYDATNLMVEYDSEATEYKAYVDKKIYCKNAYGNYDEFVNAETMGIETITNSNGTAIKYPDGTLICTNKIENQSYEITTAWGAIFETANTSTTGSTTFPVAFVSKPALTATQIGNLSGGMLNDLYYDNTKITRVNFRRPTSATAVLSYSYIAIGRWK